MTDLLDGAADVPQPKPEVILVDLSGMVHQIYHVSASEPDPDHTFKTVVNRVHALAQGQDHVAVCCDAGKSFRHDISGDYKANRPERDEVLQHQMTLTRETLAADGFPVWAVPGFEADDLVASGCASAGALGLDVLVVSNDKDLLTLVQSGPPAVRVKSVQTGAVLDSEAVAQKFGVLPVQMTDYLSLVGDASDNVAGAKGIGPKRAVDLLKGFGTLDDLYAEMDAGRTATLLTPAVEASLRDFRARLPVVRALISLRTDAPIPFAEVLTPRPVPLMAGDTEPEPQADDMIIDDISFAMPDSPVIIEPIVEAAAPAVVEVVPAEPMAPTVRATVDEGKPVTASASVEPLPPTTTKIARVPVEATVVNGPVVPYEKQLDPRTMGEAITLAKDMFTARNFAGAASPQTALATIMMGREMGIPAMTSLRTINVIEGRHSMSAQLIVGLVLKSGLVEYVEPVEISDKAVTYAAKRVGRPEVRLTHTIEMAATAGLLKTKSNWERIPTDMLVSRCSVRICRIVAPDVCANVYTPEELAEMKESHG